MRILSGTSLRPILKERILQDKNYKNLHFYLYSDKDNIPCFYYLKGIKKVLDELIIPYDEGFYDKEKSVSQNLETFKEELQNKQVILARPLGIKEEKQFIDVIPSHFDPDMMSDVNKGKLYSGDIHYLPATSLSVKEIIDNYKIDLEGKKCLILGRSNTVGLPVFELVNKYNGLATLAHSKIPSSLIQKEAMESEVIFLCTGKEGLIERESFNENQIIIDCGFSKNGGDLGFIPEENEFSAYTPVPGGVGALTSYCLVLNSLMLLNH